MSSSDYQKLKKVWYKKLAKSGFHDIESPNGQIKSGTSNWKFNSAWTTAYSQHAKRDYYYATQQFLNTHAFESELHRVIWEYHSEGASIRKIVKLLKNAGYKKYYRQSRKYRPMDKMKVWKIVDKYRKIMKNGL
jgi:hypothetical protein